jgi:transcriptional regulator with XRE-family HTH domain
MNTNRRARVRLRRGLGIAAFPAGDQMNPQLAFVARLRRERQRLGISLADIAKQTRVKPELLEAFENNDLTDWPRGLYARAWVRGYAVAVGLDPADTVDEFCRLYLHGDRRARSTIREIAAIVATDSHFHDEFEPEDRRRHLGPPAPPTWYAPVSQMWRTVRSRVSTLWSLYFVKPGPRPS